MIESDRIAGTRERRSALLAAGMLGPTVSWNLANVGPLAGTVADRYSIALATVGLFTTALFVAQLFLQIPGSRLADRYGSRRLGLICLGAIVVANVGSALVPNLVAALGFRFVIGFGVGVGFVAGSSYIRAAGGSALAQGLYGGVSLFGAGLAIAIVPALAPWLDWRSPFVSGAVVAAVGIVSLAPAPDVRVPVGDSRPGLMSVLRDRRVLRFGPPQAASFGISIMLGNWVVPLLIRQGGYSSGVAGAIGSLTLVGGILGRPAGGILAARRPHLSRRLVGLSMVLGACATAALTIADPPIIAIVGSLTIGVAAGLPFGPMFDAVSRLRPDSPAAAIAVMNAPALILLIVGTPLLGLSFDGTGESRIGFLVVAVLWGMTAFALPPGDLFARSGTRTTRDVR